MTPDRVMPVIQHSCSATVSASCRPRSNGTEAVTNEMRVSNYFAAGRESASKLDGYQSGTCRGVQNQLCHTKISHTAPHLTSPNRKKRSPTSRLSRGVVNATELRTALWRCDLAPELPLLAETCRSICVHSCPVCRIKPMRLHFRSLQTIEAGAGVFSPSSTLEASFPPS